MKKETFENSVKVNYIQVYLPLTLCPPLFLFPSIFLLFSIAVLQEFNLFFIFIYLVLLALFNSSFDNFIYFVCPDAHGPAAAAAAAPAAYPYPTAQRQPQQNT